MHHGIPAVLHRDEPWLHRHSENGAVHTVDTTTTFCKTQNSYGNSVSDIEWNRTQVADPQKVEVFRSALFTNPACPLVLVHVKMSLMVGILTFMSMIKLCSVELSMKKFHNLGARSKSSF